MFDIAVECHKIMEDIDEIYTCCESGYSKLGNILFAIDNHQFQNVVDMLTEDEFFNEAMLIQNLILRKEGKL